MTFLNAQPISRTFLNAQHFLSPFFLLPNKKLVYQSFEASRKFLQAGCSNQTCMALTPLPSSIPLMGFEPTIFQSWAVSATDHWGWDQHNRNTPLQHTADSNQNKFFDINKKAWTFCNNICLWLCKWVCFFLLNLLIRFGWCTGLPEPLLTVLLPHPEQLLADLRPSEILEDQCLTDSQDHLENRWIWFLCWHLI